MGNGMRLADDSWRMTADDGKTPLYSGFSKLLPVAGLLPSGHL
jgi:hypothetical protein